MLGNQSRLPDNYFSLKQQPYSQDPVEGRVDASANHVDMEDSPVLHVFS